MRRTARLPLFIERGSHSLQEQIYRSIRQSIVDGLVGPEQRLPSTRDLAVDLGVSRTTTLLALEQLRAEGYIVARPGSGTYIAPQLPDRRPAPMVPAGCAVARPPFSKRGYALSRSVAPDRRQPSAPPCAFRLGTPALDLFPLPLWSRIVRECLRAQKPARLDYSKPAGLPLLREAIAQQMQSRGTRCVAEQVQIVTGAQRGLDLIARMLLDPGDAAWMEDPGYTGARGALLAAGARILPAPVDGEGMTIGDQTAEARVAYVTPSCQFPLGVALSIRRRHALLDWARRSQSWIIEDDYDCDLRHERPALPCLHALDPDGRVIYVGTFSKTLFPALRLGFLIVPRDLQPGFLMARLATDLHAPVLEQRVLAAFMERGHYERHLRRMQAAYGERLEALQRAIERSGAPLRLRPVQAGMHAIADLEGVSAESVHDEAAARGIECMPLSAYYSDRCGPNALLLGFGAVSPAALRVGVTRLARVIDGLRVQH